VTENYIKFWESFGGWDTVAAQAFGRGRRAWPTLGDDDIVAAVEDLGLEIYRRSQSANPVKFPRTYLCDFVASRLHATYSQLLEPFERDVLRARRRAQAGLVREGTGPVRVTYDERKLGQVTDTVGERTLDHAAVRNALHHLLRAAIDSVAGWKESAKGRTVETIAEIAIRTLELLGVDPEAQRAWADRRSGPRRVVIRAMADVRPTRWSGSAPYELPSRQSVTPVVWQEFHGRYCDPALELVKNALEEQRGWAAPY